MRYTKPNFEHEWPEALRYRIFEKMGYENWVEVGNNGKPVRFSSIIDKTGNVDLDFDSLEKDKKNRFYDAFDNGVIEMPIVAKFSDTNYDLVGGNTRIAGLILNKKDPYVWLIDISKKGKKEQKETDTSSSGGYEAAFGAKSSVIKKPISSKIPNFLNEITDSSVSSAGAFDVPFGGGTKGRKNPLKIDGPKSIYKNRAVKDKKFPRYGGPDAVFVKIKEKCKKFPYCNQGNTGAIEFISEDQEFKDAIEKASKIYGIPYADVEKVVINEINKIFI